jgi:Outer membrane protein transport protein (OMPP1/FadL/TodX)
MSDGRPSRRFNLSRTVTLVFVCLLVPSMSLAQEPNVAIPANILLPNYERVPLGQRETLEAGAYLARSDDALSCWYNPAGLVASTRTQVSASSNAYEGVSLELFGRQQKTSSLRLAPLGSFFGVVIAEPLTTSNRYRLGVSVANPLSWQPGSIQFTPQLGPGIGVGVVNNVALSRTEPALSLGYRAAERLRLGATFGVSFVSMSQHQDVLVRANAPNPGETRRRTFVTDGTVYHVLGRFGAQWDIARPVTIGVILQTPGARVSGSTRLLYAAGIYTASGFDDVAFEESEAQFDYKLPFNAALGATYRFRRGVFEVDAHYYGESSQHNIFETDTQGLRTVSNSGGTTSTLTTFQPTTNSWRHVVNIAVGGNYQLTDRLRLHAGFNSDESPVGDPATSIFRRVDLLGFSTGVSFTMSQFSGALGLGYSTGESDVVTTFSDATGNPVATTLRVRSFRVSYAVTFAFGS